MGGFAPRADPAVAVLVPMLLEATLNPALLLAITQISTFVQPLAQANRPKLCPHVGTWEGFAILGSDIMTVAIHSGAV